MCVLCLWIERAAFFAVGEKRAWGKKKEKEEKKKKKEKSLSLRTRQFNRASLLLLLLLVTHLFSFFSFSFFSLFCSLCEQKTFNFGDEIALSSLVESVWWWWWWWWARWLTDNKQVATIEVNWLRVTFFSLSLFFALKLSVCDLPLTHLPFWKKLSTDVDAKMAFFYKQTETEKILLNNERNVYLSVF